MGTFVKINLQNIRSNFNTVLSCINNPEIKVCASIKANAYGHGIKEVVSALEPSDVAYWGMASFRGAMFVHKLRTRSKILCYTQLEANELVPAVENDFELMVGDMQYLEALIAAAKKTGCKAKVHVMVETGMGRLGFFPKNFASVIAICKDSPHIELKGVCSHLSNSSDDDITQTQAHLFEAALQSVTLPPGVLRHIANSGAVVWNSKAPQNKIYYDMVRPGIMLYGASPDPARALPDHVTLKQAMQLIGHVSSVIRYPPGQGISYMSNFICEKDSNIAIVNMGYGDGLMRSLGCNGYACINNKRYPIVGNVCMDMCMLNLGDDTVAVGSEVVFFGNDCITIDEQSTNANTISFVLCTQITQRPEREYLY